MHRGGGINNDAKDAQRGYGIVQMLHYLAEAMWIIQSLGQTDKSGSMGAINSANSVEESLTLMGVDLDRSM